MAYMWGVDTSEHQESKVDYAELKRAGASFVFLRIGYNKRIDKTFEKDYAAAVSAGLKVGVYFYTMAKTVLEAEQDGSRVLGWLNGRKLWMPVVYDLEDKVQQGSSRRFLNSEMYNSFARVVSAEYKTMLYTGEYFFNAYFNKDAVKDRLWIAKYSKKEPSVGRQVSIWQFTSDRVVEPYYVGPLDRNYLLVDFTDEIEGGTYEPPHNNPYPLPTRLLKRKWPMMTGNDVKWLQYELQRRGYDTGGFDGKFGDKTSLSVRTYQRRNGLLVDGIVGPATRHSLLMG